MAAPGLTVRTLRSLLGVVGKDATVRGALRNPLAMSGFVVPSAFAAGGLIGRPLAETISEGITGAETTRNREALESGMQTYASQFAEKLRKNREAESIRLNALLVQRTNPHLYNQIMAGRRLPQGSVVLGGQPRQDLMEEFASYMGSLPDPDPVFQ